MHYLVYKTINTVNGKFYIGAHKTSNIDDGYMGSGKALLEAFDKYGKHNFFREILHECDSEESMFKLEKSLIDHTDRNNYNLVEGGLGGCKIPKENLHEHLAKCRATANKNKANSGFYKKLGALNSKRLKGSKNPEQSIRMKAYCDKHPLYWWNNGERCTRSDICPGDGWVRGRL